LYTIVILKDSKTIGTLSGEHIIVGAVDNNGTDVVVGGNILMLAGLSQAIVRRIQKRLDREEVAGERPLGIMLKLGPENIMEFIGDMINSMPRPAVNKAAPKDEHKEPLASKDQSTEAPAK
jgi:hypothetical protein